MNGLQTIPQGALFGIISGLIGFIVVLLGSYIVFVIRSLKKSDEDFKDMFREYKDTTATILYELLTSRNEINKRLDILETEFNHILKEHDKNHG